MNFTVKPWHDKRECLVRSCPNKKHEGAFVGDLCAPCYSMLVDGNTGPSLAWFSVEIRHLEEENNTLLRKTARVWP